MTSAAHDKRLILVRHSKAEQNAALVDHDRQLTERGRRDAQAVGAWLKTESIVCDLVICSTSVRTRQTWEEAVRGGAHTEFVEYRRGVYLGGTAGVLDSIRDDAGDLETVLVVGHAPAMPSIASILCDGEGSAAGPPSDGRWVPDERHSAAAVCRGLGQHRTRDCRAGALPRRPRLAAHVAADKRARVTECGRAATPLPWSCRSAPPARCRPSSAARRRSP